MNADMSVPAKSVNLTVLRKNARGKKKPGRKQPRPGDTDYELPDDSDVKRAKLSSEEQCTSVNDVQEEVRDSQASVNDVRDSINSLGVEITEESYGRIDGTVIMAGWMIQLLMRHKPS